MINHELKTWPKHFNAIWNKVKLFEFRQNDRNFHVGDWLHLREWEPSLMYGVTGEGSYTGRSLMVLVTYMLTSNEEQPEFVADGWCIMSIDIKSWYSSSGTVERF